MMGKQDINTAGTENKSSTPSWATSPPSGSSTASSSSSPRRRSCPCCGPHRSTGPACSPPRPANFWNIFSLYQDSHSIQHGWEIVSAHLVPRKSPERLLVRVQVGVVSTVPKNDVLISLESRYLRLCLGTYLLRPFYRVLTVKKASSKSQKL